MKISNFNGWQRIWIVLSIIYGILVIFVTYVDMPTQSKIDSEYVTDTINYIKGYDPALKDMSMWQIRDIYKDISDKDLAIRIQNKWLKHDGWEDDNFKKLADTYSKKSSELFNSKLKLVLTGTFFWSVSVVVAYLAGWAVGWIYRGFKKPKETI